MRVPETCGAAMRHPIVMRALLRAHAKLAQPPRRTPSAPGPVARAAPAERVDDGGWDPYEVWRTRVLLAREARAARDAAPPGFDGMAAAAVSVRAAWLLDGCAEPPLGEIDQDDDFDPEPGIFAGGLRPLDPDTHADPDELDLALTDDLPGARRVASRASRRA